MAKRNISAAYNLITSDGDKKKKTGTIKPLGVVLTADQIGKLDQIAKDLNTNRHKIMQYAIAEFIKRWDAGERPRTREETKTILDI